LRNLLTISIIFDLYPFLFLNENLVSELEKFFVIIVAHLVDNCSLIMMHLLLQLLDFFTFLQELLPKHLPR